MVKRCEQQEVLTDKELMSRLANGDTWALGQVYSRYGDDVRRLLRYTRQDADDICHDVFLTVFRKAGSYKHMDKLRFWIYKIALREARAQSKKRWMREKLFKQFLQEKRSISIESDIPQETSGETSHRVAEAIAALTPGQREVLMLAVEEGMSGQEIAETLGIRHNAVRAKLFRARQTVAKSLNLDYETLFEKKRRR